MAFNFIKKIWHNEHDESVHQQFIRFSRGEFNNRAVINFKRNGNVKISSTFEYSNNLVLFTAFLAGKIKVSGILLSREKLNLPEPAKSKKGILQYEISREMNSEELEEIGKKAYFMLFDCEAPGISLKIKKKLLRPSKSTTEKVKDKFCILEADVKYAKQIKDEFFFDVPECKKARAKHKIIVEDVILPKEEKDPEQMRLKAKKKGKIIRDIEFDGKKETKEKAFIA